jgi:hypothetical protein
VTLSEAFRLFDRVAPPEKEWLLIDGEEVGVPYCCDVPVVFDSADGIPKLRCTVCGLQLAEITQWLVVDWGKRGVRMPKGGD